MISAAEARKPRESKSFLFLEEYIKTNYLPYIEKEVKRSSSDNVKMDFDHILNDDVKNRIKEILTNLGYVKISFKDIYLKRGTYYWIREDTNYTTLEFHW